ncbi:hypothetical protein CVS53_02689 [Microbacterium oxydans]|nr:hypothetical protein CVS53_02689 [Microbacterium oxydans]
MSDNAATSGQPNVGRRPRAQRSRRPRVVLIHNAAGGLPNVERLTGRTSNTDLAAIVLLNAGASRHAKNVVRAWTNEVLVHLARLDTPLFTFNGDVALANDIPLPRCAGVSQVLGGIHLVTRRWLMPGADGAPRALLVGPSTEPPLAHFHGSLWSHDLLGSDDIEESCHVPALIADIDYDGPLQTQSTYVALNGSPWRTTDSLPQRLLDQVRPHVAWCRSTTTDSVAPARVRAVRSGHTAEIDLHSLVDPPRGKVSS